jgi:hypothetical protein
MPPVHQTALGHLELKVKIEHRQYLGNRMAQRKMQRVACSVEILKVFLVLIPKNWCEVNKK